MRGLVQDGALIALVVEPNMGVFGCIICQEWELGTALVDDIESKCRKLDVSVGMKENHE